jgi:hypothetical protein
MTDRTALNTEIGEICTGGKIKIGLNTGKLLFQLGYHLLLVFRDFFGFRALVLAL